MTETATINRRVVSEDLDLIVDLIVDNFAGGGGALANRIDEEV